MIKDSGERREFESGAVRDITVGKGRCDLLPLKVIGEYIKDYYGAILEEIGLFLQKHATKHLCNAITIFRKDIIDVDESTLILDVAKHFEAGCEKYGERNWEKGIPIHCYIDSGVRHLLKYRRGDSDEPHDRAFVWNMLCCIWTMENHPEMNDLPGVVSPLSNIALYISVTMGDPK